MVDVTPEYLLNIVDEKTAFKIWEQLEGMRIYFPSKFVLHHHIKEAYRQMIEGQYNKADAINVLSYQYELSTAQIRRIVAKVQSDPFE